jgi:hypothetical protein
MHGVRYKYLGTWLCVSNNSSCAQIYLNHLLAVRQIVNICGLSVNDPLSMNVPEPFHCLLGKMEVTLSA